MKTSEKIKHLRLSRGMSQEELGHLVGVQKAAINKYETGRVVNIKRTTLIKLADVLGVSPADLLDDPETNIYPQASKRLYDIFSSLNEEGQEKLIEYAEDILASGKYKKHNKPEMVEGA